VKALTTTTPIVFVMVTDPVAAGLVASLDRPGGNLTGVALLNEEIGAKRLDSTVTSSCPRRDRHGGSH
jgi:putative ABC transport system substrate-binding protein